MKMRRCAPVLVLLLVCFVPACVSSTDSPIEGTILFDTNRAGNWEIYSISADGSNPTRLTNSPAQDYGPWPSPDDSRIGGFGVYHWISCGDGYTSVDVDRLATGVRLSGLSGPSSDSLDFFAGLRHLISFGS